MPLAVARHCEKRSSAIIIGETRQGEKNKYTFFLFSLSFFLHLFFFLTSMNENNDSRQERTYLTNHRISFFLFYSISWSAQTDGRGHATYVLNTINRSFIRTEHSPL